MIILCAKTGLRCWGQTLTCLELGKCVCVYMHVYTLCCFYCSFNHRKRTVSSLDVNALTHTRQKKRLVRTCCARAAFSLLLVVVFFFFFCPATRRSDDVFFCFFNAALKLSLRTFFQHVRTYRYAALRYLASYYVYYFFNSSRYPSDNAVRDTWYPGSTYLVLLGRRARNLRKPFLHFLFFIF